MQRIRYALIMLGILICLATPAVATVSIGISLPHVSIGINLPLYPELTPVPGYPVYYAPQVRGNYFFYDGMYWVYQDDYWYTSDWYNGPWWPVEPEFVPVFILRIPVRYYRQPPQYFYGWPAYAPPPWNRHWGYEWEQRHRGWNRWDRRSVPAIAPRPDYQRHYSGNRYPRAEQQQGLHRQNYRYQPRDTMVRERIRPQIEGKAPAPVMRGKRQEPPAKNQRPQEYRNETPQPPVNPHDRRSQSSTPTSSRSQGSAVRNLEYQPGTAEQRERVQQRQRSQDPELIKQRQQGHGQVRRQVKDQNKGQEQQEQARDQEQEQGKYQERGRN